MGPLARHVDQLADLLRLQYVLPGEVDYRSGNIARVLLSQPHGALQYDHVAKGEGFSRDGPRELILKCDVVLTLQPFTVRPELRSEKDTLR